MWKHTQCERYYCHYGFKPFGVWNENALLPPIFLCDLAHTRSFVLPASMQSRDKNECENFFEICLQCAKMTFSFSSPFGKSATSLRKYRFLSLLVVSRFWLSRSFHIAHIYCTHKNEKKSHFFCVFLLSLFIGCRSLPPSSSVDFDLM